MAAPLAAGGTPAGAGVIDEPPPRHVSRRVLLMKAATLGCVGVLAQRLWSLQLTRGNYYEAQATENRTRVRTVKAMRGVIYDRNGAQLVRNVPSFSVAVVPGDLPPEREPEVLARLSALVGTPVERIRDLVGRQRQTQPFQPVAVAENVARDTVLVIQEQHASLPGVTDLRPAVRQYDHGPLLAHVIGYVQPISEVEIQRRKDEPYLIDDAIGKAGVELTYERHLRGRHGTEQVEVDAGGRVVRVLSSEPARPGGNLFLTIDLALQQQVMALLQEALAAANVRRGVALVLEPNSGQVLAMASLPTYDNNLFAGRPSDQAELERTLNDEDHPLVNRAIAGDYPPASTFKMVTGPAALQERVVDANTRVVCTGSIKIGPTIFNCWARRGHGSVAFVEAVAQSCDVYFYYLAGAARYIAEAGRRSPSPCGPSAGASSRAAGNAREAGICGLQPAQLANYGRVFGFGQRLGIDLPGETGGTMPDEEWKRLHIVDEPWYVGDTLHMAIGQGYDLATPLQVASAAAAVANGGHLLQPQVVKEVRDADGNVVRPFARKVIRDLPIAPENLELLRKGMRRSVTHGSSFNANLAQLRVAGKTGTAEFSGSRDKDGHLPSHAWWVGYAPFEAPAAVVAVLLEGGGEGSDRAVPVGRRILQAVFGVGPDLKPLGVD